MTVEWNEVAKTLRAIAERPDHVLLPSQRRSLAWIATRLPTQGFVLADEVGTGKTRIACAVVEAVLANGGRAAVLMPSGLIKQWEHEWKELEPEIPVATTKGSRLAPKTMTTFPAFVAGIVMNAEALAAKHGDPVDSALATAIDEASPAKSADLWFISHGLRPPLARVRDDEYRKRPWKLALPTLVKERLSYPAGKLPPPKPRVRRELESSNDSRNARAWEVVNRIAERIAGEGRDRAKLRALLDGVPSLKRRDGSDNRAVAVSFQAGNESTRAFEALLRTFLGTFDLIVIDEAHKSRGAESDDDATDRERPTVLANLLAMLRPSDDARRIGVTATPLELHAGQWETLLARSLRGPKDFEFATVAARGAAAARELEKQGARIRKTLGGPDRPSREHELDEGADDDTRPLQLLEPDVAKLCDAAKGLSKAMKPYVTRRRRTDEDVFEKFRSALRGQHAQRQQGARPHRRITVETIELVPPSHGVAHAEPAASGEFDAAQRAWTQALFALESLAIARLGYGAAAGGGSAARKGGRAVASAYTRVAAGHLPPRYEAELEAFVKSLPDPGDDPARRQHRDRIAYWANQERAALASLLTIDDDPARARRDPLHVHPRVRKGVAVIERYTLLGKKVLVFGTFRGPMHALTQVLEVRHALRRLAAGKPIAHAMAEHESWAHDELVRMGDANELGDEAPRWTRAELVARWKRGHGEYEKLRKAHPSRLRPKLAERLRAEGIEIRELSEDVRDRLFAVAGPFVLDASLYVSSGHAETRATAATDADEDLERGVDLFWREVLQPSLEAKREMAGRHEDDDGHASLVKRLTEVVADFDEEGDTAHATRHVGQMHGGTAPSTRHLLQAKFNRPHAAPHVLIAQSRVGREGLNLHVSCRVVVQFNAEWNPAILEQQIGRVDRTGSLWERDARTWLGTPEDERPAEPPFIEVVPIVFAGTYDAYQWEAVGARQHVFDATLYGELLPASKLARVDEQTRARLAEAAPDFRPPRMRAVTDES